MKTIDVCLNVEERGNTRVELCMRRRKVEKVEKVDPKAKVRRRVSGQRRRGQRRAEKATLGKEMMKERHGGDK